MREISYITETRVSELTSRRVSSSGVGKRIGTRVVIHCRIYHVRLTESAVGLIHKAYFLVMESQRHISDFTVTVLGNNKLSHAHFLC